MGEQKRANMSYLFVTFCAAKFPMTFFASAQTIEMLPSPNCSVPTLDSQLLMLHATETALSISNRNYRTKYCTTLAAIT
jgi:hypothetical protein